MADDEEGDDDDHPLERQPQLKPPHDLFWLPTIVPPNVRILVSVNEVGYGACGDGKLCIQGDP